MLNSSLSMQKRFGAGQWSFLGPGSEKEVVLYYWRQSTRRMGQNCCADDVDICRKHTPSIPIHESIVQRSAWEQRWWKIVDTLLRRLRESIETVFRTIICVNQFSLYGAVAEMCGECESCHDRTGSPVVKGQSDALFVPSVKRTTWKVITTSQIEQILYSCKIPNHSWSWTVFRDERHWRILTIHRFSGLSWVHFAKRRRFIWTKRLDSREHQDWTGIGSHSLLPTR